MPFDGYAPTWEKELGNSLPPPPDEPNDSGGGNGEKNFRKYAATLTAAGVLGLQTAAGFSMSRYAGVPLLIHALCWTGVSLYGEIKEKWAPQNFKEAVFLPLAATILCVPLGLKFYIDRDLDRFPAVSTPMQNNFRKSANELIHHENIVSLPDANQQPQRLIQPRLPAFAGGFEKIDHVLR